MSLANFNGKEHLRHRAVSLRQHGFLVFVLLLHLPVLCVKTPVDLKLLLMVGSLNDNERLACYYVTI